MGPTPLRSGRCLRVERPALRGPIAQRRCLRLHECDQRAKGARLPACHRPRLGRAPRRVGNHRGATVVPCRRPKRALLCTFSSPCANADRHRWPSGHFCCTGTRPHVGRAACLLRDAGHENHAPLPDRGSFFIEPCANGGSGARPSANWTRGRRARWPPARGV